MISCKLCGKNFETLEGIGKHLRFCEKNLEKIKAEDYYNLYIKKESDGKCIICGKDTRFNTLDLGFSTYCGASCSKFGVNKGLIAKPRIKKPDKNPVTCRLCNIEQNNLNSLRNHLRFCKSNHDKINSEQYYEKYMKKDDEGFCIVCGNITKFKGLDRGYDKYCSKSCSRQDNIIDSKIDNTPMFISITFH